MIKLKALQTDELNGFLDQGSEFLGELRFRNSFRIDGHVRGKIVSENLLIVGESGRVEADIDCGTVSIRGTVIGHVRGRERIEVLAGARVQGTLSAPKLVLEDGASFQGDCDMPSAAAPAANHTK